MLLLSSLRWRGVYNGISGSMVFFFAQCQQWGPLFGGDHVHEFIWRNIGGHLFGLRIELFIGSIMHLPQ